MGDVIWLAAPGGLSLVKDTVVAVEAVQAEGMFNPYTDEGASANPHPSCYVQPAAISRADAAHDVLLHCAQSPK